jgi:hypothetical protein
MNPSGGLDHGVVDTRSIWCGGAYWHDNQLSTAMLADGKGHSDVASLVS